MITFEQDLISITNVVTLEKEVITWYVKKDDNELSDEVKEEIKCIVEKAKQRNKEYIIDLDLVAKWLKVKKGHLKSTLTTSYEKDVDYVVTEITNKRGSGRKLEKIMLTADCFKFLCMRSKTAKAQMVRAYYVELERNQRPHDYTKGRGVIYVIKASEKWNSVYKLGRSKDLKTRLRSYGSGKMDDVDVVHVFETEMIEAVERCCKAMLAEKQYRKIKEVYQVDIDIIKSVIRDCAKLALKTHFKLSKPSQHTGGYYMVFDREGENVQHEDVGGA